MSHFFYPKPIPSSRHWGLACKVTRALINKFLCGKLLPSKSMICTSAILVYEKVQENSPNENIRRCGESDLLEETGGQLSLWADVQHFSRNSLFYRHKSKALYNTQWSGHDLFFPLSPFSSPTPLSLFSFSDRTRSLLFITNCVPICPTLSLGMKLEKFSNVFWWRLVYRALPAGFYIPCWWGKETACYETARTLIHKWKQETSRIRDLQTEAKAAT